MSERRTWGHVLPPFCTGSSSIATVVQRLSEEHERAGRTSVAAVTVNRDLRVRHARNVVVDYRPRCPREFFTRGQVWSDHLAGAFGLIRPHYGRLVEPAASTVASSRAGVWFVHEGHYATAALPRWRRAVGKNARLALYVHTPVSRAFTRRELRRLLSYADLAIFVSQALCARTQAACSDLPIPHSVVHNGVDTSIFHSAGRPTSLGSRLEVLYAGQVAAHKGVHLLVQAVAKLGDSVHLTVVGSAAHGSNQALSAYEISLRKLAAGSAVAIDFLPFQPQQRLAGLYRSSDVVVVPSIWEEPFGMVALEAMACGAAVIASNRGGLPEACGNGGILVNPEEVHAMTEALEELCNAQALAAAQARAKHASRERSWGIAYQRLARAVSLAEGHESSGNQTSVGIA